MALAAAATNVENRFTGPDIGEAQMVGYAHGTIDRRLRDLCPLFCGV
jgi:hypothetical protein